MRSRARSNRLAPKPTVVVEEESPEGTRFFNGPLGGGSPWELQWFYRYNDLYKVKKLLTRMISLHLLKSKHNPLLHRTKYFYSDAREGVGGFQALAKFHSFLQSLAALGTLSFVIGAITIRNELVTLCLKTTIWSHMNTSHTSV